MGLMTDLLWPLSLLNGSIAYEIHSLINGQLSLCNEYNYWIDNSLDLLL